MSGKGIPYSFTAKVWQYTGTNGWYFASLPEAVSQEIRTLLKHNEEGWGRLKAVAKTGSTEWETAIWFDTKQNTYLLPLKTDIRKKEKIEKGNTITIHVWL